MTGFTIVPLPPPHRQEFQLALFQKKQVASESERRAVKRYSVDCPARLKMLGGDREGRLSDLSERGARLETRSPPNEGVSGLLAWGGQEHFCKVIWANDGSCGLLFEQPIPLSVVEQSVEALEVQTGPVANFGNIPIGQKRSRRAAMLGRDE